MAWPQLQLRYGRCNDGVPAATAVCGSGDRKL